MKPRNLVATLVTLLAATFMAPSAAFAGDQPAQTTELIDPGFQSQELFSQGQYSKLEELFARLTSSKERAEDGRYQLYMVATKLEEWFQMWDETMDTRISTQFSDWRQQSPDSLAEPIVEALQFRGLAWRARGNGFSSQVADEAWALFRKRNEQAWRVLMDHRAKSSAIPTWYERAILIGQDAQKSKGEIKALFEEGTRRFPGFHPIYFAYARQFSPRWGGSYEEADEFVLKAVSTKTNPDGEELYARLYWLIDQYSGSPESFFTDSLVSWPRMREGFDLLIKRFPKSEWDFANFAIFACRARDAATYLRLRPTVDAGQARLAGNFTYSLEVCDARFKK